MPNHFPAICRPVAIQVCLVATLKIVSVGFHLKAKLQEVEQYHAANATDLQHNKDAADISGNGNEDAEKEEGNRSETEQ